jgi:DNA repair protein SbcD/Mre11
LIKLLHFADAHIDMANYGRHDPLTGLPLRVLDFLKSLDTIIDAAIDEKVDLVIFAGDAYKDRSPAPTFQREWGKRIMRLSRAGIRTLLLIGNHDLSPSIGRANALQEFDTLEVPGITVLAKPCFLTPAELGLPLQVIALPWVFRSGLVAATGMSLADTPLVYEALEERIHDLVEKWLSEADPDLPIILTAHASVQGAEFGYERTVTLGGDLVLPGSLVKDPRLDYVALGHIHKPQDLNKGSQPPVIYPGSIERVDFGEAADDKYFIIAALSRGHAEVEWRKLTQVRPFIDRYLALKSDDGVTERLLEALPAREQLCDAIVRLTIDYPRQWEPLIDEASLRAAAADAFEFHLVKRPQIDVRSRLAEGQTASSMTPSELLGVYWKANHVSEEESLALQKLADELITGPQTTQGSL